MWGWCGKFRCESKTVAREPISRFIYIEFLNLLQEGSSHGAFFHILASRVAEDFSFSGADRAAAAKPRNYGWNRPRQVQKLGSNLVARGA